MITYASSAWQRTPDDGDAVAIRTMRTRGAHDPTCDRAGDVYGCVDWFVFETDPGTQSGRKDEAAARDETRLPA